MNKIMKYKEYIIAPGVLLLICLLLFNKVLFSDYDFLGGDSYSAKAVEQGFFLAEEEYGETPLWLPWMLSGLPAIHSFQNIQDHYYPYKVFEMFRDLGVLRFYEFIFHFVFAGLGMMFLLRNLRCNFFSSIFGGVSYMTMPYLVANLVHGHGSLMMTAAYIPWIMWGLLNLFQKKDLLSIGVLGLLLGLQLQRSHVQIAYYTWMMIGLYVLFYIIKSIYNKNTDFFSKSNPMLSLLASLILGIGMAASIYLPAISYTALSSRGGASDGGMGLDKAMQFSFPIIESLVFFIPSFFGFGGQTYWGDISFTDYPQYMGLVVLIFAIYGAFKSSRKIKYFFIIMSVIALLIAFGRHFESFYRLFYNYLPLFNKFRVPMFILIIFQFSICVLAGIGLNHFINKTRKQNINIHKEALFKILIMAIFFISITFMSKNYFIDSSEKFESYNIKPNQIITKEIASKYIPIYKTLVEDINKAINNGTQFVIDEKTNKKIELHTLLEQYKIELSQMETTLKVIDTRSSIISSDVLICFLIILLLYSIIRFSSKHKTIWLLPTLVILLSLIDVWIVNYKIINPNKNEYRKSPLTERKYLEAYLKKDSVIDFLENQDSSKYRISFIIRDREDPMVNALSNRWSAFNIESAYGYHPAKLNSYEKIEGLLMAYPDNHPLIQTLNIKYLISSEKFDLIDDWELMNQSPMDMYIHDRETSHENLVLDNYHPTYIYKYKRYNERLYFSEKQETIENEQDRIKKLIDIQFEPKTTSILSEELLENKEIEFDPFAEVNIISWSPNKIIFKTNAKTEQFLNISEIYYPTGWMVTNSKNKDKDIKIYEVNSLIRGIVIEPGENTYTMEYKPNEVRVGSMISFISFLFLLTLIIIGYRRENKK
tara:strand:+ start:563 stop:3202 length:2640 start_codon:yes stop_codon:yes gene_type:complete